MKRFKLSADGLSMLDLFQRHSALFADAANAASAVQRCNADESAARYFTWTRGGVKLPGIASDKPHSMGKAQ